MCHPPCPSVPSTRTLWLVCAGAIRCSHFGAIYNPNCCLQLLSWLSEPLWVRWCHQCGGEWLEGGHGDPLLPRVGA